MSESMDEICAQLGVKPMPLPSQEELRRRLADPATRTEAAIAIGDWARNLCVTFGAGLETGYFVGAALAVGLERSWSENPEPVEYIFFGKRKRKGIDREP